MEHYAVQLLADNTFPTAFCLLAAQRLFERIIVVRSLELQFSHLSFTYIS